MKVQMTLSIADVLLAGLFLAALLIAPTPW